MENQRMTYLDYPGQPPRVTDDAEIIATLTRKGWTVRPDPPAYDPQTQQIAWDGVQWVVSVLPAPPVPESVPAHHLRRALTQFAMRAAVEMHISMLDEGDPMRDDWKYAPSFRRDAAGIESARVSLGLTNEQVDALFIAAGNVVS